MPARLEGPYDLAELTIFLRTLYYVRENHPQDVSPRARELLVAALEAVASQENEVQVDRDPDAPPRWVTVTVGGQPCTLNIERVNAPWSLRTALRDAARFVQGHLPPPPSGDSGQRLMRIEIAATNGMLSSLDGHSRLIDRETYREIRGRLPKPSGPPTADASTTRAESSIDALGAGATPVPAALPRAAPGRAATYLRLPRLSPGMSVQLERALAALEGEPPKGLILDLRDNTGGLLDEAVKIADAFIKTGTLGSIVTQRARKDLMAHDDGHEPLGGLVVLVNRRTASGAELVAAAIKNLGRGVVLGEPTVGAASVRAFFDLPTTVRRPPPPNKDRDVIQDTIDGVKPPAPVAPPAEDPLGLLLTIGRLLAAGGAEIEGTGVQPDVPSPWPGPTPSSPDDDCLRQLADKVIAQARDPQRATLLAAAKALAPQAICRQRAPSQP